MIVKDHLFTYLGFRLSGDLGQYTMYTYCRKRPVFFIKSPPLTPPTWLQRRQRNRFIIVGYLWRGIGLDRRILWTKLAKAARLNISGYNLFLYWSLRHDVPTITTLVRVTGINPLATP